jgi:hypothetical protein
MEPRSDDPFELIAIVFSQDELALVTSRLQAEGIWAIGHSERHIGVNVGLTLALGGVKLLVHHDQAEDARQLLGEPWVRTGGVYARSRALDWAMALMLAVVTGVPAPARIQSVLVERRVEPVVSR